MEQLRRMGIKRWLGVMCASAILLFTGCKGFFVAVNNNPGQGTTSDVYVANQIATGGGTIAEYSLVSGVLTQLSGSPLSVTFTPNSIVVSPNNSFVYVATSEGIFLYTRGSDGTLTEGNNSTVIYLNANLPAVQNMVMDATSSWLIFTSVGSSNQISALQVDPTTGLPVSGNPSTTIALNNGTPQSLAISPSNTEVFLALGSAGVQSFSFAPTASSPLAATASIPVHTANFTANAVAVDTTSTYLFIAEAAPIPTTGTPNVPGVLRELTISSLGSDLTDSATGVSPSAVLPDASGLYVYVTNQADDTISGYTLKPSAGALPPIGSSPYPTCKGPVALAEDSSKSYLVDVGIGNNPDLYLYSFDQTTLDGTLDVGTTVSTGTVNPSLAYSVAITH